MKKRLWINYLVLPMALVVAAVLALQADKLWEQRRQLVQEEERLGRQVQLLQKFALAHPDYWQYAAKQQQELEQLRQKKQLRQNSNLLLQQVQQLAATEQLELVYAGTGAAKQQEQQKNTLSVNVELKGDFYAALRWLRQLERQGLTFEGLRLNRKEDAPEVQLQATIIL